MEKHETMGTIWEMPDALWEQIKPVLWKLDPPKPTDRKRVEPRQ